MIIPLIPKLRIIVLQSPYDSLKDPLVRDLFSKTVQVKIEGYQAVYPYGVLPVDTYDFISTHQLICRENDGKFEVLMGAKYITLQKCLAHNLPFPGLSVLKAAGAKPHDQAVEKLIQNYSENPEKVSFGSAWTMSAEARANAPLKKTLRDLMTVTLINYETEIGTTERFCCGVPKVKTDLYFQNLGYEKLQHQGEILPEFNLVSLLGESVFMLRCTKFSEAAIELTKKYQALWDARLVISSKIFTQEKAAA